MQYITTTSAKLALFLKKRKKKKVLLCSVDVYRPAAQKQLEVLAKQIAIVLPAAFAAGGALCLSYACYKQYCKSQKHEFL